MFNLITDKKMIPSLNRGVSKTSYQQISSTRDVTGDSFTQGAQSFKWEVAGNTQWIPSKTKFRLRCKLTANDGTTQLDVKNAISPNMGLGSNLYQSGEFRIGSKTVSRISDFMAQIDALETRLNRSASWLETIGKNTNFWASNTSVRVNDVSSDGVLDVGVDVVSRNDLGYGAAITIEVGDEDGVLTFSGGPNAGTIWEKGDKIDVTGQPTYTVMAILSNTTLSISESKTIALAAQVIEFTRIRKRPARRVHTFEIVWTPPLSIFKKSHVMPSGKYEVVLNPQTASNLQLRAIESLGLVSKDPSTDYKFSVDSMFLYVATVDSQRLDDVTYYLDLDETSCQMDSLGNTTGFVQKHFDVSPSTHSLTVAFQDETAGSDTRFSASKFKIRDAGETKLSRFFVSFAGQSKPEIDADPEYSGTIDYTLQRYVENALDSGGYDDVGGIESLEDWRERGMYHHFNFPRDGSDTSKKVSVHSQFSTAQPNGSVLLFDHYKKLARIVVTGGQIREVVVVDA
jgi:hypothetical protein